MITIELRCGHANVLIDDSIKIVPWYRFFSPRSLSAMCPEDPSKTLFFEGVRKTWFPSKTFMKVVYDI